MPKKFKELKIGDKFYIRERIVMKIGSRGAIIIEGSNVGVQTIVSQDHNIDTMVHLDTMLATHLGQLV